MTKLIIKLCKVCKELFLNMGHKSYLLERKYAFKRMLDLINFNKFLEHTIFTNEQEIAELKKEYTINDNQ